METRIKRISAEDKHTGFHFSELREYRYLIALFVKRDLFAIYKQTLLGPAWFALQPILMTLVFTLVFGLLVRLPTDGYPAFIFYFSGLVCWNSFSINLSKIANTFLDNAPVFGKVYFPRLTAPIATVCSNFSITLIQYALLLIIAAAYGIGGTAIPVTYRIVFTPFLLMQSAMLGSGFGLLIAAGTVRYRDLIYFLAFALTLWMYATPVIYPFGIIPARFHALMYLNPMTGMVVNFKYCIFGIGSPNLPSLLYSFVFTVAIVLLGVWTYGKAQKNFVDTI